MQLTINGKKTELGNIETVDQLLQYLKLDGRVAVEINREIIPRSRFDSHRLKNEDIIEIVRAIGGG